VSFCEELHTYVQIPHAVNMLNIT